MFSVFIFEVIIQASFFLNNYLGFMSSKCYLHDVM